MVGELARDDATEGGAAQADVDELRRKSSSSLPSLRIAGGLDGVNESERGCASLDCREMSGR